MAYDCPAGRKTTSVFDFKCREDTKCCCRCLATVKQHRTIHLFCFEYPYTRLDESRAKWPWLLINASTTMVGVPGRSIKSVTVIPLGTITSGEWNAHGKPPFVCGAQNKSRIAVYDFCGLIRLMLYTYVCHVSIYAHVCVRVRVCTYVGTNMRRYVRMWVCVCVHAPKGMYVHPYTC